MKQSDRKDRITVVVRCRPENTRELSTKESRNVVQVFNENTIIFDPADPSVSKFGAMSLGKRSKHCIYEFDRVFDLTATQEEIYEATAAPLLSHTLQGYNASVFAYGATGAGKTHTMVGNPASGAGVMILALTDLYKEIDLLQEEEFVKLSVSYLEVYNELIRDLLCDTGNEENISNDKNDVSDFEKKNLELCEDSGQVTVRGLSWHRPNKLEELLELLEKGNTYRSQSSTEANALSSRSHAVLQIHIETKSKKEKHLNDPWKLGKLSLVDLAGSERASVSRNCGERQKEGANINRSLLALGNCINALCMNNKKKHVPYRDSKLTRLLKDSLGGSCKTVMIANVSPSSLSYDDTHNTLKYADRAKNIKSTLTKNTTHPSAPQDQLEISNLRQQLANTQKQLQEALESRGTLQDPKLSKEEYKEAINTFTLFQRQIQESFKELTKLKTQQQTLNRAERKFVSQLHRAQVLANTALNSTIPPIKETEYEIDNIHEQLKVLVRSMDQLNTKIRTIYQEIEENLKLDQSYRMFLLHDIHYHRTVIEKQDLVDLCASKDCKLQLQQQRIQELERNALIASQSIVNPRGSVDDSNIPRSNATRYVPSRVISESLAGKRKQKMNSRTLKIDRIRNSMRPINTNEAIKRSRKQPGTKLTTKSTKSKISASRPRFTFSSPPQSIQRAEKRKLRKVDATSSSIPNVSSPQQIEKIVENNHSVPATPALKITSLGSIGSPPRRVRKRKMKLANKGNLYKSQQNQKIQSKVVSSVQSSNTPVSIAEQLSALKEKRAAEIAKRKSIATSNIIDATPCKGSQNSMITPLVRDNVTPAKSLRPTNDDIENIAPNTPLSFLKPGTLRKPRASMSFTPKQGQIVITNDNTKQTSET